MSLCTQLASYLQVITPPSCCHCSPLRFDTINHMDEINVWIFLLHGHVSKCLLCDIFCLCNKWYVHIFITLTGGMVLLTKKLSIYYLLYIRQSKHGCIHDNKYATSKKIFSSIWIHPRCCLYIININHNISIRIKLIQPKKIHNSCVMYQTITALVNIMFDHVDMYSTVKPNFFGVLMVII